MNIVNLLLRSARVHPDAPAVFLGATQVHTYAQLASRVRRIAHYLTHALGLAPGDRVALYMANCPEYLELLYASWHAGLCVVPVNVKLHAREAAYILEHSGSAVLFASDETAQGLQGLGGGQRWSQAVFIPGTADYGRMLASPEAGQAEQAAGGVDDLAWLFYTSGTTGRPKGVMQTHRNLLTMTLCYSADVDHVDRGDAMVYAAPMSHGAGMYNFPQMLAAARHVIPESGGFDPAELVSLSRHHGQLCMFAAPTMVKRLVEHVAAVSADPSGFKTIVYGGGPMYVEDIRDALYIMGDRFVQIYGQGESPMTITALSRALLSDRNHPRYLQRLASVGVAQSAVEVRVADDKGNPLPAGEVGEVLVRGDTVMPGYWNNPQATADALRLGWLLTGDMGSMDADGFLTLRDRSKDVIITGGSNVYPREVEEVLLTHPLVSEVSVVGRPHAEWGEEIVAFVVARERDAVAAEALDTLCLEHIARFKRPKEYRFVEALPKNHYGKVLKTELRKQLGRQLTEGETA